MLMNKYVLSGLLACSLSVFATSALCRDLSSFQTALRVAQDELNAVQVERDADAQRMDATEKEVARLQKQLQADKAKAAKSEQRFLEQKVKFDKAQAAFDEAYKYR
jgi:uncharacterized protein (DUF3084 family)